MELKDQINTLNLNVNPSPDKIANPHCNEARYNCEQCKDSNRPPRQNMNDITYHNCNQPGHYARYCHLPRDMNKVICDLCHQPGHFARNCFSNPTPTYARTIPRNSPYNSYPYTRPPMPARPPNRPSTTPPSRRIGPPLNPRPVNHIETSLSWEDPYELPYADPYADPYQNPWEDY